MAFSFTKVYFLNCFLAAASCYIEIILKESDNNVKLIVLDRLIALKEQPNQERVLQVRRCTLPTIARKHIFTKMMLKSGTGYGYPESSGYARFGSAQENAVPRLGLDFFT